MVIRVTYLKVVRK